jgi:pyruvate dehydrogenase E2 component (dihydrolipoamide acetyltransferase)
MAEKLLMMALSPTMEEGTIARWNVAESAAFKAGSVLCEVETDKASMDYEAPKDAVLLKIVVPEGGRAAVGQLIAVIGSAGEDPGPLLGGPPAAAPASAAPRPDPRPSGDLPQAPALPGAAGPGPAAVAARPEGQDPTSAAASRPGGKGPSAPSSYPPSSPLARSVARELGVDLRGARGSGPGGRVVERDVRSLAAGGAASLPGADGSAPGSPPPAAAESAADRRLPVSGKRAVIARRLSESFFSAPHFYLRRRADAGALMALREAANSGRKGAEAKPLSLNAFLIKLSAEAIARHPYVNSSWEGDTILERGSVDIGLAVALGDGLVTPVVRDCARKGVAAIDAELGALVAKARDRGLSPREYEGASFTISNLGSYGVEEFTAIINPPGSAILAVGAALTEPCVLADGSLGTRRAMALTLGCDHRVIDGAAGAAFLATLVSFIEEPGRALL